MGEAKATEERTAAKLQPSCSQAAANAAAAGKQKQRQQLGASGEGPSV